MSRGLINSVGPGCPFVLCLEFLVSVCSKCSIFHTVIFLAVNLDYLLDVELCYKCCLLVLCLALPMGTFIIIHA